MNNQDIINKAATFTLALQVDRIPHVLRGLVAFMGIFLAVAFFLAVVLDRIFHLFLLSPQQEKYFSIAALVAFTIGFCVVGFTSAYKYHYLRGVRRLFQKQETDITYEVASIFSAPYPTLSTLINHKESEFFISRLLLNREQLLIHFGHLPLPSEISEEFFDLHVTIGALWKTVYATYEDLAKYMLSASVKKQTVFRVASWMDRLIEDRKREGAWWWRENLSKTRGLGKELSYGMTGYIARFAQEMVYDRKMMELGDVILHKAECDQLEDVLAKSEGSNAVIVGPDGSGRYTITLALARAISEGNVYSEIEYKRMFLLDASSFELINDKVTLENTLIRVFNQAVTAHNIIFVIDNVEKLISLSSALGVDFWSLIDPYIEHSAVSLVVLADENTYAKESNRRVFEKRFETIKMRDLDIDLLLPYLEDTARACERVTGKFFAYSALETIAQELPVFFAEDAPLVKARSLMEGIASSVSSSAIITAEEVQSHLQKATGVHLGKVDEDEKEKLLHLEDVLSKNVVGQHEAVAAVARTMRRIRSGITDGSKPMGTFLFFGPTGVGKTETAKTLAKVFFGSEEYMSRLDMGEYAVPESAHRLLGASDNEGDLAQLIHNRPHGVLLLDEFEKSSGDVKDLFLRILDEGIFTNGQGRTISLRTQIIIATSNAGTDLIIENLRSSMGKEIDFSSLKHTVIDSVIERGILKPELVNRFDETIMFLPLSKEAMTGVVRKMLGELSVRMEEKGYEVVWSDDLIDYVVEHSEASAFGGRAIKRMIQDTVEDVLSKKLITGDVNQGEVLTITREDIVGIK